MTKQSSRNPAKEAHWRRMVAQQAASGLSAVAWCRRRGINKGTFGWWRRELRRRDAESTARRATRPRQSPHGKTLPGQSRDDKTAPGQSSDGKTPTGPRPAPADARFLPVRITPDRAPVAASPAASGPIEIALPDGRCVRVVGPVDRQALADVLEVLAAVSPSRTRPEDEAAQPHAPQARKEARSC
ncbi:MAG: hypothetical protein SYC29_16150 [Planctomycetota bacterium]|nr:hypothetical protein [Planctomycetota bacterium]